MRWSFARNRRGSRGWRSQKRNHVLRLFGCARRQRGRIGSRRLRCSSPMRVQLDTVQLPIGLPWLGAHFRLDSLGALFLVVVNLGSLHRKPVRPRLRTARTGARPRASVLPGFSGGHESGRPCRRRVHVPADLGVHVSPFVGAGHGSPSAQRQREAGYIYLLMASFGTLSLLLAFGLLAGPGGGYGFDASEVRRPRQACPPSSSR